jgi:arginyl-tRNA synthetase
LPLIAAAKRQPTRSARLALVNATCQTLANGLALLGIHAPEAM